MADIKKFNGFIAVDGSLHNTQKQAIEASREVKVKQALEEQFGKFYLYEEGQGHPDEQTSVDLNEFIYNNRDAIVAALNQEVLTRKKRAPKVKAEAPAEA